MIKVLTNGRWEILQKPLEKHMRWIKIKKISDYDKNHHDYNSFYKIKKCLNKNKFDIIHLNCWTDLFLFKNKKKIKYIFESHAAIPGMDFKYWLLFIENPIKRLFFVLFYPIFKILYKINIKKLDLYYVSIPGLLYLTWDTAKWLPNPVDLSVFHERDENECYKLDQNYINIFYPNWLRKVKNCKYALDLMYRLKNKYKKIRFYLINSHWHINKYRKELGLIEDNIVRLNPIKREEMPNYYSAERDLLLWSFFPEKPYAMLNMIENEAMACKAPILCCDLNEVIFEPLENLEELAYKIIEDKKYKNWYIERNYNYIKKVHSCKSVAKIYEQDIKDLMNNKFS